MDKITLYKIILNDIFNLRSKPHVVRKGKITWPGNIDCMGMYYGDTVKGKPKHRIEYYYKTSDENIFATLCHEYVHALQYENDLELDHDSECFKNWENYFETYWGIKLQF